MMTLKEQMWKSHHQRKNMIGPEVQVDNILYRLYEDTKYVTALCLFEELSNEDLHNLDKASAEMYKRVIAVHKKIAALYEEILPECQAIKNDYINAKLDATTLAYQNPYCPIRNGEPHRINPLSSCIEGNSNATFIRKEEN